MGKVALEGANEKQLLQTNIYIYFVERRSVEFTPPHM